MPDISAPLTLVDVFTEWRIDGATAAVIAGGAVGYVRLRHAGRARGIRWAWRRDMLVIVGLVAALWTSSGVLQARSGELMWMWTAQQLLLFLVIPVVVLAGQPLALVRAVRGDRAPVLRALRFGPVRLLGQPLLGPLLVPVVAALVFFGGVGSWALRSAPNGWVLHLTLLAVGALVAIPLVDREDDRASLAVGAALAVGLLELMIDAFPGIVLTFRHQLEIPQFAVDRPTWAGSALADQHTAGGILWAVAEVLDVPFLVLATVAWLRAEARETVQVDAALDAAAGGSVAAPGPGRPWWEDDPEMQERLRR